MNLFTIISGQYGGAEHITGKTWSISTEGMLQVVGEDDKPVAEYAPGKWNSIVDEAARGDRDSGALKVAVDGLEIIAKSDVYPGGLDAMTYAGSVLSRVREHDELPF